jgi:hypothetical protein
MARAVAAYVQVPVGMAASSALGALSAVFGGFVEVKMDAGAGDYIEPVNLYIGSVAESADRKSACQRALGTVPIEALEKELQRRTKEDRLIARTDRELLEADLKALRVAAVAAGASDPLGKKAADKAVKDAVLQLENMVATPQPLLLRDDLSPESLGSAMASQGGQLAHISAEAHVFAAMSGQYSSGKPNLNLFLKAHSGDAWSSSRISREDEEIARPALTISMMVQPEILADAVKNNKALAGSGLLARLVLDCSESLLGTRDVRARVPIPQDVRRRYSGLLMDAGLYFRLDPAQRVEATKQVLQLQVGPQSVPGLGRHLGSADGWPGSCTWPPGRPVRARRSRGRRWRPPSRSCGTTQRTPWWPSTS